MGYIQKHFYKNKRMGHPDGQIQHENIAQTLIQLEQNCRVENTNQVT